MDMEKTWIELTKSDLQKIEKRVKRELANLDRQISFLGRSADNAWEYPNSEENNEKHLDKLAQVEKQKELLDELSATISKSNDILNLLNRNNL